MLFSSQPLPYFYCKLCNFHSLDEHVRLLCKEIQVDFSRSMNRITFDRIVNSKPETYPFVTLPQEEEEVIPERGRSSCM